MMLPLCLTSGKTGYPSARAAKASLLSKHNRRKQPPKYTYRCPACRQWHLTRVPPEQIRRTRRSA
jgi:hypothetical protein